MGSDPQGRRSLPSDHELDLLNAQVGGRYVLRELLGRGSGGVVWRATHELLTRDYAIKFLDPRTLAAGGSSTQDALDRFRFEAQVSSTLSSGTDCIVAVHDAGIYEGRPYMVMDLARGESLAKRLARGPLPVRDLLEILEDVATALAAAHAAGIAHRDTKPANILAVGPGCYKLTDFGLAKFFGEVPRGLFVPRATDDAMLVGTPAYMSPEAISADRTSCGRGDVWSLAVTLYEGLTGDLPFRGDGWPAVAVAIMKRSFPKPSSHQKRLEPFDGLFAKAFAENIEDRFQTPRELVDAARAAAAARESTIEGMTLPTPGHELAHARTSLVSGVEVEAERGTHDNIHAEPARAPRRQLRGLAIVPVAVVVGVVLGVLGLLALRRSGPSGEEATGALPPTQAATTTHTTSQAREVVVTPPTSVPTDSATSRPQTSATPPQAPRGTTTPPTASPNASSVTGPRGPRPVNPSEVF